MKRALFTYDLPQELIAQNPADDPESARLLVIPSDESAPFAHKRIEDLPDLLPPGCLVVFNDTRVIPARLIGNKKDTGGRVEIFLVRKVGERPVETELGEHVDAEVWRALGKASKPLRPGAFFDMGRLHVRLSGRAEDDGLLEIEIWAPNGDAVLDALADCGHVPLPPYVRREDDAGDRNRYQTMFARVPGAVAAPTAGLHMTPALLGRLAVRDCEIAMVTLHVGLGTFKPVTVDDLDDHPMHTESFSISRSSAQAIARARERGKPIVAVGTTVVRALESAADPERPGYVRAVTDETRLLIQPGYRFRVVDILMTNFHLPDSTLLALVSAFGGTDRVLDAYRAAIAERYRFYSYGDAMLLMKKRDPS